MLILPVLLNCLLGTGCFCGMLTSSSGVLSWKRSGMMGKEDGMIPEWMNSHMRYLQVIPPSGENSDCGVGFTFASKWGYPICEAALSGP